MMAERRHLRGLLQRNGRAPNWDDSKPQAQRVVRCVWSCACQWCDVLITCSHFGQGTISTRSIGRSVPCSSAGGHRDRAHLSAPRWSGGRPNLALISMTGCQAYIFLSVCLPVWRPVVWSEMACNHRPLLTVEEDLACLIIRQSGSPGRAQSRLLGRRGLNGMNEPLPGGG